MPKTTEVFSIAENKLSNGLYYLEIPSMSNVRVFNMSFQRHFADISFLSTVISLCEEKQEKVDSHVQNHDPKTAYKKSNYSFSITLPPNLEFLYVHSNKAYGKNANYTLHTAKLKHAYLQNNFVVSFGKKEAKDNKH